MTNEQKINLCNSIDENLKNTESYLLNNDKDFNKLRNAKILNFNDKVGSKYDGYWLNLYYGNNKSTNNYAVKFAKEKGIPLSFYLELLNERLASHCGFKTIESSIFKVSKGSDYYGIISEDYRKFGYDTIGGKDIVYKFLKEIKYNVDDDYELEDIDIEFNINSLPIIYQSLNYLFYNKISDNEINYNPLKATSTVNIIFNELIKRYVFSYLTMQKDFHLNNWEILYNDHSAYLSPMYDLELSMTNNFYDKKTHTSMKWSNDKDIDIDEDFQEFIDYSDENKQLVIDMHNILTVDDVIKFMNNIEKRGIIIDKNYKDRVINDFSEHYNKIDNMLYNKKEKSK